MATSGRYKAYRSGDVQLTETGYRKAWLSLVSDFTTLQEPTLSATPAIGELYTISTAHVWAVGKEAIPVYVKKDVTEAPGDSTGDMGSLSILYTPKIFIPGDGPIILEMINNWLNEDLIVFVSDGCTPAQIVQFGCDCYPANVQKGSFQSGTLKNGSKGYELTLETKVKYFYNAAVSERA